MKRQKKTAVIHCRGGMAVQEGTVLCISGCSGCGLCAAACRLGALKLNEEQHPVIDRNSCVGCGLCAKACPQQLIEIVPDDYKIYAACSNKDKGALAKDQCRNSCIGCGICEKNCPADAVHVIGNVAVIDLKRCISCGMCAMKCPRGVIRDMQGIFTAL